MSGSSSCNPGESEDESSGWLMPSETSLDDGELSDELTLLNGDEDCEVDDSSFEALIKLSMRLKREYNLCEASVQLERCDKIWDTMQLVKQMQVDCEAEAARTGEDEDEDDEDEDEEDEDEKDEDEKERKYSPTGSNSHSASSIPYIKYQPVQGNGNNALPNFYLAVKSQKKLYHCVTCGKQYTEKRSLRQHAHRDHGIVMPKAASRKSQRTAEAKSSIHDSADSGHHPEGGRDRDSSKSRLSGSSGNRFVKPEPKQDPAPSSATTTIKPYACPICAFACSYRRGMTNHMVASHNMTIAEIRENYRVGDAVDAKPAALGKSEAPRKFPEPKQEASRVKAENSADGDSDETSRPGTFRRRVTYRCKPCGRSFCSKKVLRNHAGKIHRISIPLGRTKSLRHEGGVTHYKFHERHRVKTRPEDRAPAAKRLAKQEDKTVWYKRSDMSEAQRARMTRSGRKIVRDDRAADRPRRACAMNASYTEATREVEMEVQAPRRELVVVDAVGDAGPSTSRTGTPCFLCKQSYADIRKHLVLYHRINCPETILPLAANAIDNDKDNDSGDTLGSSTTGSSVVESSMELATKRKLKFLAKKREYDEKMRAARKEPRVPASSSSSSSSPAGAARKSRSNSLRCQMCNYKFRHLCHLRRHQNSHSVDGVLQPHSWPQYGKKTTVLADPLVDPLVDPLALTDCAESSESRVNASDEDEEDDGAERAGRKRRISQGSSDERLSTSSEDRGKKRKLEQPPAAFVNLCSGESTSDSVQDGNERETVIVMSCRDENVKAPGNPRDTRDSSDRDSGIGISITIKKRNNSYEVVEKDSGDDDKSKDFGPSKDASDSSSDATAAPLDVMFVDDDQEARRREILSSLDRSAEEKTSIVVVQELAGSEFREATKAEAVSDEETKFRLNDGEFDHGEDSAASSNVNVPSLSVMCRTALGRDDDERPTSGAAIHRCPVCQRLYPSERDVTVHMLEHKVARDDFRAIRVHAIPGSALRRYGRRDF